MSVEASNILEILESDLNFNDWIEKPYLSEALKENLKKANVLIVPFEKFRGNTEPCFMAGTAEFYNFIQQEKPTGLVAEICIDDENYLELHLHNDTIKMGKFLVTAIVVPSFLYYVNKYIDSKFESRAAKDNGKVSIEIYVENSKGKMKHLKYDGPVNSFKDLMDKEIPQKLIEEGKK